MSGKEALALIWLLITMSFAVASAVDHLSFFSLTTIGYLFVFIVWVIVEMIDNE